MEIGYYSEPVQEYVKALGAADTLESLQHTVMLYRRIAADAVAVAEKMGTEEFYRWRAGLALERKGKFAGEEWALAFGEIMMPRIMLLVGMAASHFHVPWGVAFIRMKDFGQIVESDGIAIVLDEPAKPLPKKARKKRATLAVTPALPSEGT